MKNQRYNIRAVMVIILCCVLAVLLFPMVSNDKEIYTAVICVSIGIVIFLLLYLIKVHVFETDNHKHITD